METLAKIALTVSAVIYMASLQPVWADAGHGKRAAFGRPGEDHHVTQTIEVRMGEMYFAPADIKVSPGETVRFIVVNEGKAVHEFNLGTEEAWEGHTAEMERMVDEGMIDFDKINHTKMKQMGMMHTDPNAVLIEPGETAEIIWEFPDKPIEMGLACNVPGHRESGMVGSVEFTK